MTPEHKERRRLKHLAQNGPKVVLTDNVETGPTPDDLGLYKGGIQALKSFANWVGLKARPTRFADWKNTPGKQSREAVERSADYFKRIGIAVTTEYPPESIDVVRDMVKGGIGSGIDEPAITPEEPGKGDFEQPTVGAGEVQSAV